MKALTRAAFASCLLAVGGTILAFAQTSEEQSKLIQTVNSTALPDLAKEMETHSVVVWPELLSDSSQEIKTPGATKPSVLGLALFDAIRTYEKATPRDSVTSLQAAAVYSSLSRGLLGSGGYVNYCLANAVTFLATARLAEVVINDSTQAPQVKTALDGLAGTQFSVPDFLKMIHEEAALKLKPDVDLTSLDEKTFYSRMLGALGESEDYPLGQFGNRKAGTTTMISGDDPGLLLHRMAQVHTFAKVTLDGLLGFYQKGGHLSDINPGDIRPFNAVMNGSQFQYKCDLLNIKQVRTTPIVMMMKDFKNPPANGLYAIFMQ